MGNAKSKTNDINTKSNPNPNPNPNPNSNTSPHHTQQLSETKNKKKNKNRSPNETEVKLVRESWAHLTRQGDFKSYGALMMTRLFESHPELKSMWKFASHLHTKQEMLMSPQLRSHGNNVFEAIHASVNSLDKTSSLNELLVCLGQRHVRYGVKAENLHVNNFFCLFQ